MGKAHVYLYFLKVKATDYKSWSIMSNSTILWMYKSNNFALLLLLKALFFYSVLCLFKVILNLKDAEMISKFEKQALQFFHMKSVEDFAIYF